MKHPLLLMLSLAAVLSIVACGGGGTATTPEKSNPLPSAVGQADESAMQAADEKEVPPDGPQRDRTGIEIAICLFVAKHLEELEEFKGKEDFALYGFAIAGPYNRWLLAVQAEDKKWPSGLYDDPSLEIRASIGDLLQIGADYVSSRGKETAFTRTAIPALKRTIGYPDILTQAAGLRRDAKQKELAADPEKAEKLAAARLKQAQRLIELGKPAAAKRRLTDLIDAFPNTSAAEESQRLLKDM